MGRAYVPHVNQDGARFHVLAWSNYRDDKGALQSERHCSDRNCEINREADERAALLTKEPSP